MIRFGKAIVRLRIPILILAVLLLVPSVIGMEATRINYDILTYLPDDIDTMKGQEILLDEFGKGAFALVEVEGMSEAQAAKLVDQFEEINHVDSVLWYTSLAEVTVPMEILPDKYYEAFNNGDATLMAVFFDDATSSDTTMEAVSEMRSLMQGQIFIAGATAAVVDLKQMTEEQEAVYVGIAVALACLVMIIFLDSWLLPFIFLAGIGISILWNMGTNIFFGEISFITKALSAVLQLAVTMDYSIFLWNSYQEQKVRFGGDKKRAMAHAISNTVNSVVGSSLTTIAGFIALCFMSFTLGFDLGLVMAKGVLFGVVGCVTVLPAMILVFAPLLEKTMHKRLMPDFTGFARKVLAHPVAWVVVFALILIPAVYGYRNVKVYYNLNESLPDTIDYKIADTKVKEDFGISTMHMIIADSSMSSKEVREMTGRMEEVDGVELALAYDSVKGSLIPDEVLPDELTGMLKKGDYQLMLILSSYAIGTDEVNAQIDSLNEILDEYDEGGMLIGEAPCTKDLITITDHDFAVVNAFSIVAIFAIILLTMQSLSLPFILVAVIEFAIFINLGISCFTGTEQAFIAPICISTIQLGATVDYAILMTNRYKKERSRGAGRKEAAVTALSTSMPSVIVSALGFFASTFGVAVYTNIDIIRSICNLISRGALISMAVVILILPNFLYLCDGLICRTSRGFRAKEAKNLKAPEKKADAAHTAAAGA